MTLINIIFLVLILFKSTYAFIPTQRHQDEDWRAAAQKHMNTNLRDNSAYDLSTPAININPQEILKKQNNLPWEYDEVVKAFNLTRDHQFLSFNDFDIKFRRSTWLYPDDGCFARSDLLIKNALEFNFPKMQKIFSFGNLSVLTGNNPNGNVSWWYHVVPIVHTENETFVFDPAIEPLRPLKYNEWIKAQGDESEIRVSICPSSTYMPYDPCLSDTNTLSEEAIMDQKMFLDLEWSRLIELDRNPKLELGDYPPWKYSKWL